MDRLQCGEEKLRAGWNGAVLIRGTVPDAAMKKANLPVFASNGAAAVDAAMLTPQEAFATSLHAAHLGGKLNAATR